MQPFTTHTGRVMPLRRGNVDTDQIIPADYLKRVTRSGFADGLFAVWREDPGFVLNRPEWSAADILVAGPEFGIGSSREHAVWALRDFGFKAVVSSRFADIFRGNALKAGLPAVTLPQEQVDHLWAVAEADPACAVTLDLAAREIRLQHEVFPFELDDHSRHRLLEGIDDITTTLSTAGPAIEKHEAGRRSFTPRTLPTAG